MTISGTADIERRRISDELHNRVGPSLATVAMNLRVIAQALAGGGDPDVRQLLEESQSLLAQTVGEIRELSGELRPARLEYAGLEPALMDFAAQYRRRTGVDAQFTVALSGAGSAPGSVTGSGPGSAHRRLDPATEWLIYRVIQEALSNVARHASAGRVLVDLRREDDIVRLQISDDGVGFRPEAVGAGSQPPGLGLLEMRERIESAMGRFSLNSRPGHGTHILATLPVTGQP